HGQRRRRLPPPLAPVAVSKCREQQRRGFTRHPRQRQQYRRQDSPVSRRHNHGRNRLRFARSQGHGAFPQIPWHSAKELFRAAQRDRNHHQSQRKRPRQRRKMLERQNHHAVSKNPDHDGWHAV